MAIGRRNAPFKEAQDHTITASPNSAPDRQSRALLQHSNTTAACQPTSHDETDASHDPRQRDGGHVNPAHPSLEPLAEDAWILRFGDAMDVAINARVHDAAARLRRALPDVECVPAYASLLLRFEPSAWRDGGGRFDAVRLREAVMSALRHEVNVTATAQDVIIPVWYGGAAGQDLEDVAAHAGLTTHDVIARHTAAEYRVAMIGFAPGFPYLLGLDPALAVPRRAQPRTRVPAGSVAIGGLQTGIYPQALPGGWQLIGRTPLRLFDVAAAQPSLLQPGDRVRFRAITEEEFTRLAANTGLSE